MIDLDLREKLLHALDGVAVQLSTATANMDAIYQLLSWRPWWQDLAAGSLVKAATAGGCAVYVADRATLWAKRATWVMTLTAPPLPDGAGGAWLQVNATPQLWVKASDVVAA